MLSESISSEKAVLIKQTVASSNWKQIYSVCKVQAILPKGSVPLYGVGINVASVNKASLLDNGGANCHESRDDVTL